MADTTVKYLHSGMPGAPQITNVAGTRKAVLDACLLNGWGLAPVDSLVVVSGIATATVAAGHPFEAGQVSLIAGAVTTGGSLNGEQRLLSVTSTTYSFAAPSGMANQTASGSITHKVAPLGWACPSGFSSGNIAAYHSIDAAGSGAWVRLDDTTAYDPRVRGYRTMTDHSTGTNPFPTTVQLGGSGLYWPSAYTGVSAIRPWMLWGDGRTFYFAVWHAQSVGGTHGYITVGFGDFASYVAADSGGAFISGGTGSLLTVNSPRPFDIFAGDATSPQGAYLATDATGLADSIAARRSPLHTNLNTQSTQSTLSGQLFASNLKTYTFPNPAGGGLVLSPAAVIEPGGATIALRGLLRGVYFAVQEIGPGIFADGGVTNDSGLPGRQLRAINHGLGPGFFDATGPW